MISPQTGKIVAIVLFTLIMSGVYWIISTTVHALPHGIVNLIAVGIGCLAVGFLLGQRHGIER